MILTVNEVIQLCLSTNYGLYKDETLVWTYQQSEVKQKPRDKQSRDD